MSNLIDGQTINSYAVERIKQKAWLNSVDDNKWEKLPMVRKRKSTLTKYLPLPHSIEYTVPTDITKISMDAFVPTEDLDDEDYMNPLEIVHVPDSVGEIEPSAFGCCFFLKNIEVDENNLFYKSVDGVLFSKDGKKLLAFPAGRMDENYIVPEGVEMIGENAFQNSCAYKITMPSTLKEVQDDAFWYSYNTIVDFSGSVVERVGERIFDDVEDLTVITNQDCLNGDWSNVKFQSI